MFEIAYSENLTDDTKNAIQAAGFDGYIAYGPYRSEINGESWAYYDEPEADYTGHKARYLAWRRGINKEKAIVVYGDPDKAIAKGVYDLDYAVVGLDVYPWLAGLHPKNAYWRLVKKVARFHGDITKASSKAKTLAVVQAFKTNWLRFPNALEHAVQRAVWQAHSESNLFGFASFIWNAYDPSWDTLDRHPEAWPNGDG